ncbi:hypothetical protein Bbelb_282910 [Branchiostoma belcheri]|nr:hypothetical protein Bbelb_282910 [Branchiostoma belcheri]
MRPLTKDVWKRDESSRIMERRFFALRKKRVRSSDGGKYSHQELHLGSQQAFPPSNARARMAGAQHTEIFVRRCTFDTESAAVSRFATQAVSEVTNVTRQSDSSRRDGVKVTSFYADTAKGWTQTIG